MENTDTSQYSERDRTKPEYQMQSYKLPFIINQNVEHELLSPREQAGNEQDDSQDVNADVSLSLSFEYLTFSQQKEKERE